jgi:hypothetical protein
MQYLINLKIMRKTVFFVVLLTVILSCNKEDSIRPSAEFTTNIENNTLKMGQDFTVYLDKTKGEWLVYFRGATESITYDPEFPNRRGINVSVGTKSVDITGYANPGEYVFTVVASSSGNWSRDYLQDVKSINITVTE